MGGGLITLCGMVLLLPLLMWQEQAQKRRLLSPHELNLRRATQPLGLVAVLAWGVWLFGARTVGSLLAPVLRDPAAHWLPLALLAAVLLYGFASFVSGASRCWGARSDGMLPVWAFFKCAAGMGGLVLLRTDRGPRGDDLGAALFWLALNAAAIWCAVVGAARFVLLTVGGGNALALVNRHIRQTQITMRPVRPRPWWKAGAALAVAVLLGGAVLLFWVR